jgi:hypothetical protein
MAQECTLYLAIERDTESIYASRGGCCGDIDRRLFKLNLHNTVRQGKRWVWLVCATVPRSALTTRLVDVFRDAMMQQCGINLKLATFFEHTKDRAVAFRINELVLQADSTLRQSRIAKGILELHRTGDLRAVTTTLKTGMHSRRPVVASQRCTNDVAKELLL